MLLLTLIYSRWFHAFGRDCEIVVNGHHNAGRQSDIGKFLVTSLGGHSHKQAVTRLQTVPVYSVRFSDLIRHFETIYLFRRESEQLCMHEYR